MRFSLNDVLVQYHLFFQFNIFSLFSSKKQNVISMIIIQIAQISDKIVKTTPKIRLAKIPMGCYFLKLYEIYLFTLFFLLHFTADCL